MESIRSAMSAGVLKSDVEAMWNATNSAQENADMAPAVAAMNVLADWIKKSKATTMMELQIQLKTAAEHIESFAPEVIAIIGGCELFIRYVTRSNTEIPDFEECKTALVARSAYYKEMTLKSRNRIAELGETFIRDGSVVLLHGNSRVVQRVLQAAGESGKRFSVMLTEGQPDGAPSPRCHSLALRVLPRSGRAAVPVLNAMWAPGCIAVLRGMRRAWPDSREGTDGDGSGGDDRPGLIDRVHHGEGRLCAGGCGGRGRERRHHQQGACLSAPQGGRLLSRRCSSVRAIVAPRVRSLTPVACSLRLCIVHHFMLFPSFPSTGGDEHHRNRSQGGKQACLRRG